MAPFVTNADIQYGPNDFVARLPAHISTEDQLFDALNETLRFPYFGRN